MRARKIDTNQPKIVDQLRQCGISVQILSAVGKGCPDLMCGVNGRTYCFELKNPDQPKSAQALTAEEVIFKNEWKGHYAIIRTIEEALEEINRRKI
jgi:hypothetical protein